MRLRVVGLNLQGQLKVYLIQYRHCGYHIGNSPDTKILALWPQRLVSI